MTSDNADSKLYLHPERWRPGEGSWEEGHTVPLASAPWSGRGGECAGHLKSLLPLLQTQQMPAPRWHLEMPGKTGHGEHSTGLWNYGSV